MHGKRVLVKEIYYGASDHRIYLRVDFAEAAEKLEGLEVYAEVPGSNRQPQRRLKVSLKFATASVEGTDGAAAYKDVLEIALPVESNEAEVRLSFWQDGLPVQAIPPNDYLRIVTSAGWNA